MKLQDLSTRSPNDQINHWEEAMKHQSLAIDYYRLAKKYQKTGENDLAKLNWDKAIACDKRADYHMQMHTPTRRFN